MKKLNFKIFFITTLILVLVFSLFFISNTKVSAQAGDEVIVKTTGYSVLSSTSFIFGGYYSGNFNKKGFTTYFEFKKNNSNLDTDTEETIKIIRDTDVEKSNDFYTSPELNLFSTYYFRAVGYLNDNPGTKFYGNVLSIRTGYIPYGAVYPFTVKQNNNWINCISVKNGVCEGATGGGNIGDPINGGWSNWSNWSVGQAGTQTRTRTCNNPSPSNGGANCSGSSTESIPCTPAVCGDGNNGTGGDNTGDETDSNTGLVPCYGSAEKPCGFYQFLTLINKVIKFILFKMVIPIAAIMFAYAGFELITSGGSTEKKSKAKKIFTNVAIGLIVAVAAFLIIQTILSIVGYDKTWDWFGF